MNNTNNLTQGNVTKILIKFAFPYLLSCFMQTFYGMADLYVVGKYHGAETISAVSIGSQVIHMLTVIIVGFAMGTTVRIGRAVGAKDSDGIKKTIGTSIVLFAGLTVVLTTVLLILASQITIWMQTPYEAVRETKQYLWICFAGIPFIVTYNVISSVYRGAGDSKRPMFFVFIACLVNIILDFVFIGGFGMGAAGAAFGTILGQAVSCIIAFLGMKKRNFGFHFSKKDITWHKNYAADILKVGTPIACQDGLIQIAFMVITIIANRRGLIVSSSVGIVEKIICFMFLVPSAFLSAISAITAQNMGAGEIRRAKKSLYVGLAITVSYGMICFLYNQVFPHTLVGLFTKDTAVLTAGCQYLKSYSADCLFAAIHFCFSGYFVGIQKSEISFIHNIVSILLIRIPGAYLASIYFPKTLYPMGLAAPIGSLLSALICIGYYMYYYHKKPNRL